MFNPLLAAPIGTILLFLLIWYIGRALIPLRKKEAGFEYVCVEDDSTVRELDEDEQDYLSKEFHGADGGRPHIKYFFWSKTPDKKIGGYIRRRKVPWWIEIKNTTHNNT